MTVTIGRRELLVALGGAAVAWPLAVRAQQPAERMRRIGVLMSIENDPDGKAQLSGFAQGLAEMVGLTVATCAWKFVGVAATSIGHRFLPKSWSPYSRM